MNVQLIENLIISNNETCPDLTYPNPLLDKDVALALSKSFMKILNISKENTNKKLRHTVLEKIRNTCKIEPDDHMEVDENVTELLIAYFEKFNDESVNSSGDNLKKMLDAFLIRMAKENTIRSSVKCPITPEVVQALLNLNNKTKNQDALVQDIIHWNQDDKKCIKFLKDHWYCHKNLNFSGEDKYKQFLDDASIKISTEIEKLLLDIACETLSNENTDLDEILNKNVYKTLIEISAISKECFQICISILNTIFIMNNFHFKIQKLILVFLKKVKLECKLLTTAVLYPMHLNYIAALLDIEVDIMTPDIRTIYSDIVNECLSKIQKGSETELILLLSHFPQWKLNRKRKYIPETENYDNNETQCENEEETLSTIFEQHSQSYSDDVNFKPQKQFKDSMTCTEIVDKKIDLVPSIIDLHGCKHFGKFVSNELLRFDADQRYIIVMQKILEVLKNGDKNSK